MHNNLEERHCRICNFDNGIKGVRDKYGYPTYNICPNCGVEFGYEDSTDTSIKKYKEKWQERK